MKTSFLLIITLLIFFQVVAFAQTTKTKTTKTTTTTKKSSKPDVEINMSGKIEINVFGDGNETTNSKTTTDTNNKPAKTNKPSTSSSASSNDEPDIQATETMSSTSKFDFVSGEKVILMEDFSATNIGDFPLNWNTNSSAEVVTLSNQTGKWLQLNQKGNFLLENINQLPENFTFEFDVICTNTYSYNSSGLFLNIANLKNKLSDYTKWMTYAGKNEGIKLEFEPAPPSGKLNKTGQVKIQAFKPNESPISNIVYTKEFNFQTSPKAHIAIWRQKERVRVYVNQQKIFDMPKAMLATNYNAIFFGLKTTNKDEDKLFISNIKLAVGGADTRNKLLDEGKFSTSGILFDVNADVIKPESYGVLLTIANIMNENSDLKIKIVGHTDSDGDSAKNLDLSKRRANSVKIYLIKNFGIDGSRLETDGKGSTQPIDKANNKEAKANNRRVEFIKL